MHGHPEEPLVCLLAALVGRPVKWIESRSESLLIGGREQIHRFEVAFDGDGVDHRRSRDHFVANVGAIGATPGWGDGVPHGALLPDRLPDPDAPTSRSPSSTNKGPWNATRGYGKEATNVVMERIVDLVAAHLGLDPAEVRRRNLIPRPTSSRTARTPASTSTAATTTRRSTRRSTWSTTTRCAPSSGRARGEGRYLGIGIAFELTPGGRRHPRRRSSAASTRRRSHGPSGQRHRAHRRHEPGRRQRHRHRADRRGRARRRRSTTSPSSRATPTSARTASATTAAAAWSSAAARPRSPRATSAPSSRRVAAVMLEAERGRARASRAARSSRRPGRSVALGEVSLRDLHDRLRARRGSVEPPLEATRVYRPDNIDHAPDEKGRIQPYPTYSNAVHVAVVEVDVETGKVDAPAARRASTTAAR